MARGVQCFLAERSRADRLGLPGLDGLRVLEALQGGTTLPPIIVITARDDMQSTIRAMQLGAYDYLVKPLDIDRLRLVTRRAIESRDASRALHEFVARAAENFQVGNIIGKSPAIREIYKAIGAVSTSHTSVLIQGESGTGKELVAKAIHYASADRGLSWVSLGRPGTNIVYGAGRWWSVGDASVTLWPQ